MADSINHEATSDADPVTGSEVGESSAAADALAAELAKTEARRRDLQSERDRLAAEIAQLRQEAGRNAVSDQSESNVQDVIRQAVDLTRAQIRLSQQYPHASDVDPLNYGSVQELEQAMARRNEAIEAEMRTLREAAEAEVRATYEERLGPLPPSPAGPESGPPALQAADLARMSFKDLQQIPIEEHLALARRLSES